MNKGLLCSTLVKIHADNRASLGDCSASDVTKTGGLVESSGLTGGVGSRSIPFSSISDSVAQTKSFSVKLQSTTCFHIFPRSHFPYPCRRNDPMCQAIL